MNKQKELSDLKAATTELKAKKKEQRVRDKATKVRAREEDAQEKRDAKRQKQFQDMEKIRKDHLPTARDILKDLEYDIDAAAGHLTIPQIRALIYEWSEPPAYVPSKPKAEMLRLLSEADEACADY